MSGQIDRWAMGTSTEPSSRRDDGAERGAMTDRATRSGQARELHAQSHWAEACEQFAEADRAEQLDADDLERYAEAAQILGRGDEAIQLLRRAFNLRIAAREVDRAIVSAFWLFQALIINAEFARARGWAAQVRRSMPDVDNGWFLFTRGLLLDCCWRLRPGCPAPGPRR